MSKLNNLTGLYDYNSTGSHDYNSKLLLLGDSSVGKTCLMHRFVHDKFSQSYITTIGIDFVFKEVNVEGQKVKLQIWDTAGQERFRSITTSYFKDADTIIVVYDMTNADSFTNIKVWLNEIRDRAPPKVNILLVCSKIDLELKRQVSREEGLELAKEYKLPFFECSAKRGIGVTEIFYKCAELRATTCKKIDNTIIPRPERQSEKKCC